MKEAVTVKARVLPAFIALFITVIFVVLLLSQISPGDIIRLLSRIDPFLALAGFVPYTGCYFFRAIRFSCLFNKELSAKALFPVVCVHNLLNQILPVKTGELSYIYIVRKIHNRTTGECFATLLIARLFDVVVISLIFLVSFIFAAPSFIENQRVVYLVVVVLGLFIGILFLILYHARTCMNLVSAGLRLIRAETTTAGDFLERKGSETVAALEKARSGGCYSYGILFALSCGIWGSLYGSAILIVTSMNLNLPVMSIVFACSFGFMTAALPVQGIGNFGSFEAGWTAGFLSISVPVGFAITTGFAYHIVSLFYAALLGGYGFLTIGRIGGEIPSIK